MCSLFGLIDYKGMFNSKEKNAILSVLSIECEARGIDATGVAYNANGRLCVYKRPLPAHKLRLNIPSHAKFIMGHTRLTTQGSEKQNRNNHPFQGTVQSGRFALAHNGVLYNDAQLRKKESLPQTKIQTESFVAVQLLEKENALNFGSLKQMAEKVEGSFTFTVLDRQNNLYVVRGSSPFALCHFAAGFYLYASTDEILAKTMAKLGINDWQKESVLLSPGDILKIDSRGKIKRGNFDSIDEYDYWLYQRSFVHGKRRGASKSSSYVQDLKSVAQYCGVCPDDVDYLLADGFSCDEIEEMLYMPNYSKDASELVY